MKKLFTLFTLLLLLASWINQQVEAQCTNTSAYGSATAPLSGTVTFSTCSYLEEYSTLYSVVSGTTYSCAINIGGFITVRSGTYNGPVVAFGNSPLQWTATTGGTHYCHWNTNSSCGTATGCVTTTCTFIGASSPSLTTVPGSQAFGYVASGGYGYNQYALSGANLGAGPIVVTAPLPEFGVSLNPGGPFTSFVNVGYAPPTLTSTFIYVQFAPTGLPAAYSGNITNLGGGASTDVAVSGTSIFSYCASYSNSYTYEYIQNVNYAGINNTTGGSFYTDYTGGTAASVSIGTPANLSVTIEPDGAEYIYAWIDWNHDAVFADPGERVLGTSYTGTDPYTVSASVTPPPGAYVGITTMRVTDKYSSPPGPCEVGFSYGEVEDYAINVLPAVSCLPPTNQTVSNITQNGADLNWFSVDSFFDIFTEVSGGPAPGPGTIPTASGISGNTYTWAGGQPAMTYDWYVRTDCGFTNPKVDNFWVALDPMSNVIPPFSGGTFNEPGEDGMWYLYDQGAGQDWWNIWFYNDPLDLNKIKKIRMGFWVQPYMVGTGTISYVVNWSDDTYTGPGFPTPLEEAYIERSPINGPIVVNGLQWVELYYVIPDFNPKWISVDLWGDNIIIEQMPMSPPPGSPLFTFWNPSMPGGLIVHECLPESSLSTWTGPNTFTTQCAAYAMPFIEDFNLGVVPPLCWSETITNAGYNWQASGTGNARCPWNYAQDESLISPAIQITQIPASLQFKWMTSYYWLVSPYDNADLICYIGINGGPWIPVWNEEMEGVFTNFVMYTEDIWLESFGVQSGDVVQVRFQYVGDDAGDAHIEDVKIFQQPLTAAWNGSVSTDWFDPANWDTNIPGVNTDVAIPAGLTNYPTILNNSAYCDDIFLGSNTLGTATLLDNGLLTVGGTATVERYYASGATWPVVPPDDEWHLISSPISDGQVGIYTGLYLQWFEEGLGSGTWHDITVPTNALLTPLQGYALYVPTDGMTFNYVGTLNTGIIALPVSAHGLDIYHWNLFGNPYPSSLDWDLVKAYNIPFMQTGAVYYLDQATGAYLSYNAGVGAGSRYVPPEQGFFVSIGAEPNAFVVDNSMRTHTGGSNYYKAEFDNLLVLEATGNNFSDATYLRFDAIATPEIDKEFDAFKLFTATNPYLPQLYTVGGNLLSINVLPETEMVSAGFKAGVPGEYIINIKDVTGMSNVVLEDLVTGIKTDLLNGSYTFNYNLADPDNRFIIHFTPLAIGENAADLINIYSSQKDVYVSVPANTKGDIVVYNLMGQEVSRTQITDVLNKITLDKSAYYVVKVMSDESVVTKKVFVK